MWVRFPPAPLNRPIGRENVRDFPSAIIGAMVFLVDIELTKFAKNIRLNKDLIPMGATISVALLGNMALGFIGGLAVYHLTQFIIGQRDLLDNRSPK